MTVANNTTDLRYGVTGELGCKAPCRGATITNITLEGEQTANGIAFVANDIALVNGQTDTTENGVYIVSTSGWTRAVWFDDELDALPGTLLFTKEGTQYANTLWVTVCADNPIVFGTSEITFSAFDVAAVNANIAALAALIGAADKVPYFTGPGAMAVATLTAFARSLIDDINAASARTTLELGTAAILNTGIASGDIPTVGTQSATEILAGLTILASNAITSAGVNDASAISPKSLLSLYPASSKTATGYVRSPINNSGQFQSIFEQWGEKANIPANTTVTVTLPGSFTTTMFAAKTTAFGTNTAATEYALQVSNFTVSSFDITNANGAARSVYWSAIGY